MYRIRIHTNPFHFYKPLPFADLKNLFQDYNGKIDLEIGVGDGLFLKKYAVLNPEKNIIGVEIRKPLVEKIWVELAEEKIHNILLFYAKAENLIKEIIPKACIENLFIFHPDPWVKKYQNKRRVINQEFLNLIKPKLIPNGKIYVTTDNPILAEDISAQFKKQPEFKLIEDEYFWQNYYETHWQKATAQKGRNHYFWVFSKGQAP